MSTVLVTGASGFLGSTLAAHLEREGFRVLRTVRPGYGKADGMLEFSLGDHTPPVDEIRSRGLTAVVHCAWDFRVRSVGELFRRNVTGTVALARAAADAGVHQQVYISTLSAFPGCVSQYGRAKLLVEERLRPFGAAVLRPGLLYAAEPRGLTGTIKKLARTLPIVPLIGSGSQPQYTCHVDDLCAWIVRWLQNAPSALSKPVFAAHPEPLPFHVIVRRFAAAAGRPRPLLLPVPWWVAWAGLRLLELFRMPIGLRSDSVLGLQFSLPSVPDPTQALHSDLDFRPFNP